MGPCTKFGTILWGSTVGIAVLWFVHRAAGQAALRPPIGPPCKWPHERIISYIYIYVFPYLNFSSMSESDRVRLCASKTLLFTALSVESLDPHRAVTGLAHWKKCYLLQWNRFVFETRLPGARKHMLSIAPEPLCARKPCSLVRGNWLELEDTCYLLHRQHFSF